MADPTLSVDEARAMESRIDEAVRGSPLFGQGEYVGLVDSWGHVTLDGKFDLAMLMVIVGAMKQDRTE